MADTSAAAAQVASHGGTPHGRLSGVVARDRQGLDRSFLRSGTSGCAPSSRTAPKRDTRSRLCCYGYGGSPTKGRRILDSSRNAVTLVAATREPDSFQKVESSYKTGVTATSMTCRGQRTSSSPSGTGRSPSESRLSYFDRAESGRPMGGHGSSRYALTAFSRFAIRGPLESGDDFSKRVTKAE